MNDSNSKPKGVRRGNLLEQTQGQIQSEHVGNDGLNLPLRSFGRRGFLGGIAAFAAQCVIDPEFALWRPGERSFFIPDAIVSPEEYYRVREFSNAEALAAQREAIRPQLESMMIMSSILWNKIQVSSDLMPLGTRPGRIPMRPSMSSIALASALNPFVRSITC